jgi:hypothetical protein
MMSTSYAPLSVRLLRRREVDPVTGCWLWTGAKNPFGYGNIGGERGVPKNINTHRAAYELYVGPIPPGMVVMHSCDRPACFNPAHLSVGTPRDNTQDMIRKGRDTRPSRTATHCKHGHPFDEQNTRRDVRGRRVCRECMRRHSRNHYRRNPAKCNATTMRSRRAKAQRAAA